MGQASPEWYCRTLGMELGPMPWSDLKELVRQRELAPDDDVRCGATDGWRPAKSVANLAEEFQRANNVLPTRLKSSVTARAVASALAKAGDARAETPLAQKPTADDERWHCRIAGAVYGPIRFAQLLRIIAHQKLEIQPQDEVRHGTHGDWVRVESIPALMRAGGLDEPITGLGTPVLPPANPQTFTRPAPPFETWIDKLPALPSWELPDWLLDLLGFVGQGLWFLVKYSFVIGPAILWITFNIIAVFYPTTGEALWKMALACLASPVTWFGIVAVTAYAAAIWLNLRG